MKKCLALPLVLVGLGLSTSRILATADYLFDNFVTPDEAAKIPTPFTPLPEEKPTPGIFRSIENPFIRDIDFTIAPRLYFRSLQNATGVNNTFAGGGLIGMTTGWLSDTLQLGLVGYGTALLASNQTGLDRTGLVGSDGNGFAVLGQAWGKLKFGPVIGTFYRQEMELPFIHGDDSRIIPNTFEAYQISIEPLDWLTFNLGYVARIKRRNSFDFMPMSQAAGAPNVKTGVGFFAVRIGRESGLYFDLVEEATFDLYNCFYAQGGYTWHITSELELRGDLQFADQRNIGSSQLGMFSTQLYGAQLATSYGGAVLTLAYNHTANTAGIRDPYGADPSFTGLMLSNFVSAGENAFLVGLSYDFGRLGLTGLSGFANYVYGALPGPGGRWQHEVNGTLDYRINKGPLKNFWLRLRYADLQASARPSAQDFRVIVNYSYRF